MCIHTQIVISRSFLKIKFMLKFFYITVGFSDSVSFKSSLWWQRMYMCDFEIENTCVLFQQLYIVVHTGIHISKKNGSKFSTYCFASYSMIVKKIMSKFVPVENMKS